MTFLDVIEANWLIFGAVLLLAILIAWWIWGRAGPDDRVRYEAPDVLDEGAAPAERNTLLMEASPAASFAMTTPIAAASPGIMGGMGELIAAAAAQEIDEARRAEEEEQAEGTADAAEEDRPVPATQPAGEPDDLGRIKGVGPKLVRLLGELGVTRYDQIAAWSDEDVARIDAQLGPFQGRIVRDNWVEQCRYLAAGDVAGYEAKFGKL
jgi:predicted flap endonuclease-1-like 5' DNA nuclease